MKCRTGWCANGFELECNTRFSDFIACWPKAQPRIIRGERAWTVDHELDALDTYTIFEDPDGEEAFLEALIAEQRGGFK